MSRPTFSPNRPPPDSAPPAGSGGACATECQSGATDALWQYLQRIEGGLDQIDARIDRLYLALGGGTVLLAAIGLGSAFIMRGG